jgi:uroporphyrinogen-III synthase
MLNMPRILITRPRAQSAEFGAALQRAGFEPVFFPVIEIRPASDLSALDAALNDLGCYAWVVFTSVNAVEVFFERLAGLNAGLHLPAHLKIAAIGPKTAAALRQRNVEPLFTPDEFVGDAILPGLGDLLGKRVLLPRAEIARVALPEGIVAAGGLPDEVVVYQTLPAEPDPAGLLSLKTGVDWITFTSPSTVQNFAQTVRQHGLDPLHLPGSPKIACIGPVTCRAAEETGFTGLRMAQEYTADGLVKLISEFAN